MNCSLPISLATVCNVKSIEGTLLMIICEIHEAWTQFLDIVRKLCTPTAFGNWITPIEVLESSETELTLKIPNIFFKEYLLSNYREELCSLFPVNENGEPNIKFVIEKQHRKPQPKAPPIHTPAPIQPPVIPHEELLIYEAKLNNAYRFQNFIEGHSNQFVK